jgi:type IV secretory pathway VirB10-like protein
MDRKTAAQKLLDIAGAIDKQASEESFFVCHACNHTASLATINNKRVKVASESGVQDVDAVTVNDVIACPACGGDMRYIPTDSSEKYYVESADEPAEEIPLEDPAKVDDKAPGAPPPPPAPPKEEEAPDAEPKSAPTDEMPPSEDDEDINLDYEGDEDVEDLTAPSEEAPSEEAPAPVEEVPAESEPEPKKAPKKKKDKPDDGKPNIPKDRVPKFEFPKKAGDESFMSLVGKYL